VNEHIYKEESYSVGGEKMKVQGRIPNFQGDEERI
jgi:hypothetical protein